MRSTAEMEEEGRAAKSTEDVAELSKCPDEAGPSPFENPKLYWSKVRELYKSQSAMLLGNFLEWYDWGLFGYMERLMTHAFYGNTKKTWNYFAVPFVARPVGALLFSWLADSFGRRLALLASVALMGTTTFAQGCLAPHEPGMIAIQTVLRIGGGFSAGGESLSSSIYMSEIGSQNGGRLYAAAISVQVLTSILASLAAAGTALLEFMLTQDQQDEWGWRVPFLAAGPFALLCLYMRTGLPESPEWEQLEASRSGMEPDGDSHGKAQYGTIKGAKHGPRAADSSIGFTGVTWSDIPMIIFGILLTLPISLCAYMPMIFASWLRESLDWTAYMSMWVAFLSRLESVFYVLPAAFLADEYGGSLCVLVGCIGVTVSAVISTAIMSQVADTDGEKTVVSIVAVFNLCGVMPLFGSLMMTSDLMLTGLFPTSRRGSMLGFILGFRSVCVGFFPAVWEALSDSELWLPWMWFSSLMLAGCACVFTARMAVARGVLTVYQRPWLF